MQRVLVLAQKRSYRADDILAAAARLGVRLTLGTDRCHVLAEAWRDDVITLKRLEDPDEVITQARLAHAATPFAAVLGTCDLTSELAAVVSSSLGLHCNPPNAARIARNKALLRACLSGCGVPTPRHLIFPLDLDAAELARRAAPLGWPLVIKPLQLSGSRGVMRVDDEGQLTARLDRLRRILGDPEVIQAADPAHGHVLVESYVPGVEVAVEGLLRDGALEVLAFFDKPDPLEGPYFEETIYVTPSRLPPDVQQSVIRTVKDAARAMGLVMGPVHAELRLMPDGEGVVPMVIEAAARSIGGLCARTLRFGTGRSLDEIVLEAALERAPSAPARSGAASGVMMLPIPRAGILHGVHGVDDARAVPGVEEVTITARSGEELVPLPEGSSYLGFMFARGETPELVEKALREGHRRLRFDVTGKLPVR